MARLQEPGRSSPLGLATPVNISPGDSRPARHPRSGQGLTTAPAQPDGNVLELLRPGSFVKLRRHPSDLPPFQLIRCQGGRCWVRQQSWGPAVHWEVPHRQLKSLGA